MSYTDQDQLANDAAFQARVRSCAIQQADQQYSASTDARDKALADAILRYEGQQLLAMFQIVGAGPGLADKYAQGGHDQGVITDGEVLANTQAAWPKVADAFYNEDGTPQGAGLQLQTA